jgi:hypothetical protein
MGNVLRISIQLIKCRIKGKFTQDFLPTNQVQDIGDVYSGVPSKEQGAG